MKFFLLLRCLFPLICLQVNYCYSDGVFGCGGFVKSDVDINYSLVEVKLYTPHGSIKYQTDCAPNTGYYLIPLYDKGDYILKTEPPKGWGFEPASVQLKVDGETDLCSKGEDINFKFTGFSIYGKLVSLGQEEGPAGVTLTLTSNTKPDLKETTLTEEGGSFSFSSVMPGDYKIKASHATWQFSKGEVTVQVKSDNANVGSALSLAGYDVKGEVTGDGHPMKSVNFVLFSTSSKTKKVTNCEAGAPKGFHTKETKLSPLCYVTSREDGSFVFPVLPSGEYFLIPFYKGEHITFDVEPGKLDFVVGHGSLLLKEKFEVAGFSVNGKVLDAENGAGISQAAIIINGVKQTQSGADGSYSLENMKTGTYRLTAQLENVEFEEMAVEITPQTPQLPSLIAKGFSLCGKVVIDRVPESLGKLTSQRRIIYYPEGKGSEAKSLTTDANGAFCETVKPGKYVVKVHMSEPEVKAGLTLTPSEKLVEIVNKPFLDVTFSQFRAKISGSVKCMEKCQAMDMTLDPVGRGDSQVRVQAKLSGNEATFVFENVMPGKYKVSIVMDSWCWKERSLELTVSDSDLTGLEFVHTGYILKCSVSHPITMNFAHDKKEKNVGSFLLDKGLNRFCLANPGVYKLTPDSCHKFDQENYNYDTSKPETLTLTALQHQALGTLTTEGPVSDIVVTIKSSVDDAPTVLGPLQANASATAASKQASGDAKEDKKAVRPTVYNFAHWARSGETLFISARSADLLFYPEEAEVYVSGDSCPGTVVEFKGRRGVFIEGGITPALAGVKVTITAEDESMTPVVLTTGADGKYKLGPLHADKIYTVTAEKEGYVLSEKADKPRSFQAFKLGEISVQMLDEQGVALPSVLLSLSGEKQYRSNQVTGPDGLMTFGGLSPGQYFLRPMMKEFKFEPVSQMINVQEGSTEKLVIKGARVAFSCFGQVTSLNGEAEPGVIIEAIGQDECSEYQEESKTEMDGTYRIRGLQPKCNYDIRIKSGDMNAHIERTAPKNRVVSVTTEDLYNINIIAFRRMNQMDISGNIKTNLKFLPTLKVRLVSAAQPDSPIHVVSLSKSTFFFLPSLQMEDKEYILSVESTLSRQEYDYKLPSVEFPANRSHRHFTLEFNPKLKSLEQDLNQGSFLLVPLVALALALAYNYKTVLPYLINLYQQLQTASVKGGSSSPSSSPTSSTSTSADASIPQEFLASESSPVKKRAKPRKAQ